MTPKEVLSHPPRVLTQAQREHYFEHGYVGVESLVPADILAELVGVTNEFVEASRSETVSGRMFDIGPGPSKDRVVLRRLKSPDDRHEACQINSQMIACPPDTIGECRKSHIGATAFTPTLSAEPFGSTFASR